MRTAASKRSLWFLSSSAIHAMGVSRNGPYLPVAKTVARLRNLNCGSYTWV